MRESTPKLSINQCREIIRVRQNQIHELVTQPDNENEIYNQISDAFNQIILALSEYIDDEEITRNVNAFVKDYDTLAVRLGIHPYISEVEDSEEGEPDNSADEP
jgi:hypothetical protein